MSADDPRAHLLPPRPRPVDWIFAGGCGGLLLGLAELAVSALGGGLPPPLALALVACDGLLGLAGAAAVALGLVLSGRRPSHSALAGGTLGPLLLAAAVAPAWGWLAGSRAPAAGELAGFGLALLAAGVAGGVAARLADRAERSALPVSGPVLWSAAATLVAVCARVAPDASVSAGARVAIAGAGVVAAAGFVLAAHEWVRRRGSRAPIPFPRLLVALAAGAVAMSFAPRWLPWLLDAGELPPLGIGPPNLLVVALETDSDRADGRAGREALERLAWEGVTYERVRGEPRAGVAALLTLPGGKPLVPALTARGYASAALVTQADRTQGIEAGRVDARAGGRRRLERSAGWSAAAPALLGPGAALLAALGFERELRSPDQLAADARRWLVEWRTRRAAAPFFLLVDFRAGGDAPEGGPSGGVAALLEQLVLLGVDGRTLVLLAIEDASGRDVPPLQAVVRPPPSWPVSFRGLRVARDVEARELGGALLAIGRSDAALPGALPGMPAS